MIIKKKRDRGAPKRIPLEGFKIAKDEPFIRIEKKVEYVRETIQ